MRQGGEFHRVMRARRFGAAVACAVFALVAFPVSSLSAADDKPSFFDTLETMSDKLDPFKKWNEAVEKYTKEKALAKEGKCGDKEMNKCNYTKWVEFLAGIKEKDLVSQIREINDYMNRAPYITDPVNWGEKDYWASPGEFMTKFGDCEDYAIAKFMSLKMLGYNEDDLRVVAVKDLNLKIGHAILVVFYEGKPYVLDNQIKQVMPATKIKHYVPQFSINTKAWWRHRPAG
ncbi:MAG: transglutaminase-like cysteine peptidase [Alphaproteobacteria bacterium]|nr:transglutaminase-like cysteine peptidase [Alphaproteobacteria bacterium]